MTSQQHEENVPALRFPEFGGVWKKSRLENIAELIGGFAFPSSRMTPKKTPLQVIKMSNLYGGHLNLKRNASYLAHIKSSEERFRIEDTDILISLTGTVGKRDFGYTVLISNPKELYLNQRVGLLRVKKEISIGAYLSAVAKTDKFQKQFHALAIGGTGNQANVSLVDCRKLALLLPAFPEQKKIAAFLSAVDRKIGQLSRKKQGLEHYKKGMMQKLFSQELRFKDDNGNHFPDWQEKRLGDVATFSKGKGISKADIVVDGANECIRYGQLYTDYGETISTVISRTNIPENELVLSEANDIIIPASGETHIDIATASCILRDGIALGGDLNIIKTKYDGVFLSYYLNSIKKIDIARLSQGISVVHLYAAQLKLLNLHIPSLPEQQKIASFLSAIDQKIDIIALELTHAAAFKKGLLQQMFV